MPRVADLPRGWRHWSPAQKIEHLLGMSLDRAHEILSWRPIIELDPPRLSLWAQVWRVIFMVGTKALLDGKLGREATRERARTAALDELVGRFDGRPTAGRCQPAPLGASGQRRTGPTRPS